MMSADDLPQNTNIKIGDSVKVRNDFYDSELGVDMSGWQGRVRELYPSSRVSMYPATHNLQLAHLQPATLFPRTK